MGAESGPLDRSDSLGCNERCALVGRFSVAVGGATVTAPNRNYDEGLDLSVISVAIADSAAVPPESSRRLATPRMDTEQPIDILVQAAKQEIHQPSGSDGEEPESGNQKRIVRNRPSAGGAAASW